MIINVPLNHVLFNKYNDIKRYLIDFKHRALALGYLDSRAGAHARQAKDRSLIKIIFKNRRMQ